MAKLSNDIKLPISLLNYLEIEGVLKDHKLSFYLIQELNREETVTINITSFYENILPVEVFESFEEFENHIHKNYEGDTYRQLRQAIKLAKLKFKK